MSALSEAILMPAWARSSVSLIALPLAAVKSSSSLTRSRMGSVCRLTYVLRANGFTRPQKPSRAGACKGCLPVAVSVEVVAGAVAWVWVDEVWAKAGNASTAARGRVKKTRLFIGNFLQVGGAFGAPLQHAETGVLRDF